MKICIFAKRELYLDSEKSLNGEGKWQQKSTCSFILCSSIPASYFQKKKEFIHSFHTHPHADLINMFSLGQSGHRTKQIAQPCI